MVIYKITNCINNKSYIGQTVQKNPKMRWYDHQAKARKGIKHPLFNALSKYGVEKFIWEVIDSATTIDQLNMLEEYYVTKYDTINNGYNICKAGGNKIHHSASIEKMKASQKNAHARRRKANGGVETMNRVLKTSGWKHSEESKLKRKEWSAITNKLKAKPLTDEHKQKVSEAIKQSWAKRKAPQEVN